MTNFHESMWPDRVSNAAPLTSQSDALLTVLCQIKVKEEEKFDVYTVGVGISVCITVCYRLNP